MDRITAERKAPNINKWSMYTAYRYVCYPGQNCTVNINNIVLSCFCTFAQSLKHQCSNVFYDIPLKYCSFSLLNVYYFPSSFSFNIFNFLKIIIWNLQLNVKPSEIFHFLEFHNISLLETHHSLTKN